MLTVNIISNRLWYSALYLSFLELITFVLCIFYRLNLSGVYHRMGLKVINCLPKRFFYFFQHVPLVQLRKMFFLGYLNSHSLWTILSPISIFCGVDWRSNHNLCYITAIFLPLYHVSIHLNKFNHLKNGNSSFLQNVRIFNRHTVQKSKQDTH